MQGGDLPACKMPGPRPPTRVGLTFRRRADDCGQLHAGAARLRGLQPFRVFTVELVGRERFEVDHPGALVARDGVAVFLAPGGVPHWFDHEGVLRFMAPVVPATAELCRWIAPTFVGGLRGLLFFVASPSQTPSAASTRSRTATIGTSFVGAGPWPIRIARSLGSAAGKP